MVKPVRGDPTVRDEIVRISEYTVNTQIIEGFDFVNCRIIGPAVLILLDGVEISHCTWNTPDLLALFWEIPSNRPLVIGAVGLRNCIFSNCTFENIGVAGGSEMRTVLASGFTDEP